MSRVVMVYLVLGAGRPAAGRVVSTVSVPFRVQREGEVFVVGQACELVPEGVFAAGVIGLW